MEDIKEQLEPIYFPPTKEDNIKKYVLWVGIIVGVLAILFLTINIFTPKPKLEEQPFIKNQIDSLAKVNMQLRIQQQRLDSISQSYQFQLYSIDDKLDSVTGNKTLIKEYYREKIIEPKSYSPKQIDSFFKKRYKY